MVLTRRQKQVLDFIRTHTRTRGYAPTLAEIRRHLGLGSVATVHKHLRLLQEKGAVRRLPHRSRALEVCDVAPAARVRLLGTVAAGTPIGPLEIDEVVTVPEEMLGPGETFALRVRGDSMIDDGIHDGDVVLVERRSTAVDGATVVAVVRGEATIKPHRPGRRPMSMSSDSVVLGFIAGSAKPRRAPVMRSRFPRPPAGPAPAAGRSRTPPP